jgi:integrase
MQNMTKISKSPAPVADSVLAAPVTLANVLAGLERPSTLTATRLRDLRSATKRVADLLGNEPAGIPLDLGVIGAGLNAISPVAAGMTPKRFANIRSDFLAAVKASKLKSVQRSAKTPLSAAWITLMADLSTRRAHIGLSRLARYASANGIKPAQISDATIQTFIAAVRNGTLHRKPNDLHRKVALIWNEAVQRSDLHLQRVTVPSFRRPAQRIEWARLPSALRKDVDGYLTWCAGIDLFAANARSRALAPQTIKLRQNEIHAAITALVESGVAPNAITSLADLVSLENFKHILRRRHERIGGRENVFNHGLARSLVEIAVRWVKVDAAAHAELRRLAGKVPMPISGLTSKNKRVLRQFDDPAVLSRLYHLPMRLWAEVKRDAKPNVRTLVKAQTALAVAILCHMPIRLQNLAPLAYNVHLFMHEAPGATSCLELSANEVKNKRELAFDIPADLAKMLIEYRNRIAPKVIGRRPDRLFVKADGTPKTQWMVAWMIRTYLKRRAGITLSSHQFRHLSAKVLLDAEPGNFETVRQLLGHASLNTTVAAYAGIDSRRAARHHQRLVEQALAPEKPARRSKKWA